MSKLKNQLISELKKIPNVSVEPSPVAGGSAVFFNTKEVAHFHIGNILDLKLGKILIQQNKLVHPKVDHLNRSENSPWFEYVFNNKEDIELLIELFKQANDC